MKRKSPVRSEPPSIRSYPGLVSEFRKEDGSTEKVFLNADFSDFDNEEEASESSGDEGEFGQKSDSKEETENEKTNGDEDADEDEDEDEDEDGEDKNSSPEVTHTIFPNLNKEKRGSTSSQVPSGATAFGIMIMCDPTVITEDEMTSFAESLRPFLYDMNDKIDVFSDKMMSVLDSTSPATDDVEFFSAFVKQRDEKLSSIPKGINAAYCGSLKRSGGSKMSKKGTKTAKSTPWGPWKKQGRGFMQFADGSTLIANWENDSVSLPSIYFASPGVDTITKNSPVRVVSHSKQWLSQKTAKKLKTQKKDKHQVEENDGEDAEDDKSFCLEYNEDGAIEFAGYAVGGIRHGLGVCVMPDGAAMVGRWHHGLFSGPDNAWYYDGRRPYAGALRGAFRGGKMRAAKFVAFDEKTKEVTHDMIITKGADLSGSPLYLSNHDPSFTYSYDPSKAERISKHPLQVDPWESARVEARVSGLANSGEGLFARRALKPFEMISFYNGTRPSAAEVDARSWDLNSNAITVVDDEDTCIDVAEPFDKCDRYCASLSHKANHCFDWNKVNAVFELCWHPRFGKLKAARLTKAVQPGEEIFVDYGYELSTPTEKEAQKAYHELAEKNSDAPQYPPENIENDIEQLDGPDWWKKCLHTDLPILGRAGRMRSAEESAKREEEKDLNRAKYVCQSVLDIPSEVLPLQIVEELKCLSLMNDTTI